MANFYNHYNFTTPTTLPFHASTAARWKEGFFAFYPSEVGHKTCFLVLSKVIKCPETQIDKSSYWICYTTALRDDATIYRTNGLYLNVDGSRVKGSIVKQKWAWFAP